MIRSDAMNDVVDAVSQDAFYAEKHRIIFRAMLALWGKGEPIDIESLRSKLAEQNHLEQIGGISYLAELASEVPAASNARHYGN
ncbi:DnaB-like helicase N-terminal domain-containing protein, partial [Staphylococcus aureus]|uniref:DnaB-like helicase N-terminal domain-containing protein n=1 Tax=Staphylococcus aureus TaxID=1280 RepID=UPI0039BDB97B